MNGTQVAALVVFALSYGAIVSGRVHRTIAAIAGAAVMGLLVLRGDGLAEVVDWQTILFIFGMMVVIGTMQRGGAFRWLGLHAARIARLEPLRLFVVLPLLAAGLAAFVDSITVMLFLAALTIEVCRIARLRPLSLLIAEITAANIGGVATMVGDPPNVILGTHFGLSFGDFALGTGPLALIGVAVNTGFMAFLFREDIRAAGRSFRDRPNDRLRALAMLEPAQAIRDRALFSIGWIALAAVVALLVTHGLTGLPVGTIGTCAASLVLVLGGPRHRMPDLLETIDWTTLVFFGGLFLIVGGLERSGALEAAAGGILRLGGGTAMALSILLWVGALGSAMVDNVPFAATMAPVIGHMVASGLPLKPLVWAGALGTDIGGNATPIGAAANVIGVATYERATGERVTWREYLRAALPATALTVSVLYGLLLVLHG